ncbi:hypothetical protein HPB49_025290 [Dermacentor silvarum]|uniref:Uncharacterized protein n=1 Tax=Dermacentor silvarum TaxID=543639 RepID=A0ACB8DLA2_DERSI|nr:hypothetical protein HPB49_025290 [Dermacentor silvarum]
MDGWSYTLAGFGDFLELRRVTFAEPMPATRVCGVCGLLPSLTRHLPCGHVLCDLCVAQIVKCEGCPFDGRKFALADVRSIAFERSELDQCRVHCTACDGSTGSGNQCDFAGKLSELRSHLSFCGNGEAKCGKCHRPVFRGMAVYHYRQCSGETVQRRAAAVGSTVVGRPGGFKKDLDEGRSRVRTPSRSVDAAVNAANALAERVAGLERELLEVRKRCRSSDDDDDEQGLSKLRASKNKTPVTIIPGPYRAASGPGVLITTCKFADIYAGHATLNEDKRELRISSDTYTLGGYTFRLDCQFCKYKNETCVRFILFLREGDWDGYVEWPFSKKVTLIVMHPRDAGKDVRLPLCMDKERMVKKPKAGAWNWGQWTDKINWEYIELRGFIDKETLYVNVEFE